MSRSTPELLHEALVHLDLARSYADTEDLSQLTVDAVCMRLAAAIDVLARLDAETRSALFGDSWLLMWGMRNRIVHGYLLVNPEIIRQTVATDLPDIIDVITHNLADAD